jgi:membrane protein DedA with SNARE-associated domain
MLSVLLGYLIYEGYLSIPITFMVLLVADTIPDIFLYYLGRYGNKKILMRTFFKESARVTRNIARIENLWHKHTVKTMFFGKLAFGVSVPIILSAGISKLPIKRFLQVSIPVGMFEVAMLLYIGYHLGVSYQIVKSYVQYSGLVIALFVLIVFILYRLVANYSTKVILK